MKWGGGIFTHGGSNARGNGDNKILNSLGTITEHPSWRGAGDANGRCEEECHY